VKRVARIHAVHRDEWNMNFRVARMVCGRWAGRRDARPAGRWNEVTCRTCLRLIAAFEQRLADADQAKAARRLR